MSFLIGVIAVIISSTPISDWYCGIAVAVTLLWIASRFKPDWRRWTYYAVIAVWLSAAFIELPYHTTNCQQGQSLAVIRLPTTNLDVNQLRCERYAGRFESQPQGSLKRSFARCSKNIASAGRYRLRMQFVLTCQKLRRQTTATVVGTPSVTGNSQSYLESRPPQASRLSPLGVPEECANAGQRATDQRASATGNHQCNHKKCHAASR